MYGQTNDEDIKSLAKAESCQRPALYGHFSDSVTALSPGHLQTVSCTNCRQQCSCDADNEKCAGFPEVFISTEATQEQLPLSHTLSTEDKKLMI